MRSAKLPNIFIPAISPQTQDGGLKIEQRGQNKLSRVDYALETMFKADLVRLTRADKNSLIKRNLTLLRH